MAAKITRDVVESHLRCRYKSHLKLAGERGERSDYELMLDASRDEVRLKAVARLLAQHGEGEVVRDVPLTAAALRAGPPIVLDALSLHFDGLKKADGASDLGGFHYLPVLFHEGRKVGKEQRRLLELLGLLLSRVQGRAPAHGVVWHGRDCKATRVRLNPDPRKAERLLRELREAAAQPAPPKLLLNDHCQVCEFRQRCHEQAVKEDNLSLLRGMGEKEVRACARKGILTVTQLAHTFRPRRKGKRQTQKAHKRHHALQALAVRDRKVYVLGTPELRDAPVRVYLDVEGDPDEGYVYLIGIIVAHGDTEQRHSFWADGKDQEADIFERFLAEVCKYDDFVVLSYGSYERAFLKRMSKEAKSKEQADRALGALVNVLSVVYDHVYFPTHSNGLKEVATFLGCSWSEPGASGTQSVVWRKRWEATGAEEWKGALTTYNLEDCAALKKVTELVAGLAARGKQAGPPAAPGAGPDIGWVNDLDRATNLRKWGTVNFFHPDYEYVNYCAYFDYQRDRVYVRTSKLVRKGRPPRHGLTHNRRLRVTKRVTITCATCPSCGGYNVSQDATRRPRRKRAFDLVLTSGAIKRAVVECSGS